MIRACFWVPAALMVAFMVTFAALRHWAEFGICALVFLACVAADLAYEKRQAIAALDAYSDQLERQYRDDADEFDDGPPWQRRMLIPLALSPLLIVLVPSGQARAAEYAPILHTVSVAVAWDTGTAACINLIEPVNGQLVDTYSCNLTGIASATYQAVVGDWIGVDPETPLGTAVSCIVLVDGAERIMQAGYSSAVSCLERLV